MPMVSFNTPWKLILWCIQGVQVFIITNIKGAPKLYFMHYSCVVITLFSTGLRKSALSTYSFEKLLSFCTFGFFVCSLIWIRCHLYRLYNIFVIINISVIIIYIGASWSVILFSLHSNSFKNYKNMFPERFWVLKITFLKKNEEQ